MPARLTIDRAVQVGVGSGGRLVLVPLEPLVVRQGSQPVRVDEVVSFDTDGGVRGVWSLADRLDKLTGLFALKLRPSGAADPYGLRRDALGVIVALLEYPLELSLRRAIALSAETMPIDVTAEAVEETAKFIERRLSVRLGERCERPDLIAAVIAGSGDDPRHCAHCLDALAERLDDGSS